MNDMKPVSYEKEIPDIFRAMIGVHQAIDAHGLEPGLRHLVHLRASQINRCAFCVKMHVREAREDGETSERLDRVVVWDVVGDFSEKERAALAWTEALSVLDAKTDYGALRARLRRHFSEQEIGALTATIAMVNAWNRINIARH
jgi:AhpD family alkylhydroperoxidase